MPRLKKPKSQSKPKKSGVLKESAEKMEAVFQEGHELFTKLISVIPDAILVIDMNGKIIFINELGFKLVRYSNPRKIIGRSIFEFLLPEQHKKAKRGMSQRLKGNISTREYQMVAEDGSLIPFEVSGNVLRYSDGKPFAWVYVGRDISERKKVEKAVIKSEQKYSAILNESPDPILIRDKDGNIVDANKQAVKFFGYSKKELIDQHVSKMYSPEDFEMVKKVVERANRYGKARLDDVYVLRKDGQKINVDAHGSRFTVGEDVLYKIIYRDMTEQRKMREQLKKAKIELEATIVERTMELMQANTALKVLLSHQNKEKADNEERLMTNIKAQILPHLQALRKGKLDTNQMAHMKHIEMHLQNIMSEFLTNMQSKIPSLTPKEIQVVSLVKEGLPTKEIARLMGISTKTVDVFRYNIRKKMGLNKEKENLRSHLMAL